MSNVTPTPLAHQISRALVTDQMEALVAAYAPHPVPLSGPFEPARRGETGRSSVLCWAIQAQAVRVVAALIEAGVSWDAAQHEGVDPVGLALAAASQSVHGSMRSLGLPKVVGLDPERAQRIVELALGAAAPLGERYLDAAHEQPVLVFALDGLLQSAAPQMTHWQWSERLLEAGLDAQKPGRDKAAIWAFLTAVSSRRLRDTRAEGANYRPVLRLLLDQGVDVSVRSSDFGFANGTLLHAMVGILHYQYATRPIHAEFCITAFLDLIPYLMRAGLPLDAKARALPGPRNEPRPGPIWRRATAYAWAQELGGYAGQLVPLLERYHQAQELTQIMDLTEPEPSAVVVPRPSRPRL